MTYEELRESLFTRMREYHPSNDFSLVERACDMAFEAHGDQLRKSGEPYIIHPLSVAYLLADLELDIESIVSGLLHDVIEDTAYSYDDIAKSFGQEVADIVDGLTKLETIELENERRTASVDLTKKDKNDREELQAENYRKMFLAMAKDIRVVLIKIADRLHNMRTLQFMKPDKQKEKAQETLEIYAPLTDRLGISKWRWELEDLCFKYLEPEAYADLTEKVALKQAERQTFINSMVEKISDKVNAVNLQAAVEGRPKHFFSIYKKMRSKGKEFDQIYDLFAVRVLVNSVRDCYEVLGILHEVYSPVPGTFKDYIGMPKDNMYQSLHTVILPPDSAPVEVQIRTWDMHKTAEFGIAAHWKYKAARDGAKVDERGEEKLNWLRQILDWQRGFSNNKEFMAALKTDLDVYSEHVYCFTPHGEVINMQRGANCIDFAYRIHSAVGNRMVGARVNGVMAPIETELKSGDRIEIITSSNSRGPSRDWLKLAKTSQARLKIQQWFKKETKEEDILRGRDLLERDAREKGIALDELLTPERREAVINRFGFLDWDTLCASVGHGALREGQVINRLHDDYLKELDRARSQESKVQEVLKNIEEAAERDFRQPAKTRNGVVIKGVGDVEVRFSRCCSPVPGDEIVGFITRGRGMSIHRTDCVNILNLSELERHRLIEAWWQLSDKIEGNMRYVVDIRVTCEDRPELLLDMTRIFAEEKISIKSLHLRTVDNSAIFDMGLEITGREQFERARMLLLNMRDIHHIERVTT